MDRSHEKQTVDLRLGLQSTLKMMEHKIRKHQVEVERSWPEDLPPVYGNPGELNQIWTNLIDNALDAMPEGGTLGLAAGEEDGWVKVHVRDTGTGIPQDVLPNIFDPFFTTKGIDQGTGLGLDVVKKLVNGHQGQIKVDSRPGQTVFTVCFPLFRRA
jgi:signal transduction histidine kinase